MEPLPIDNQVVVECRRLAAAVAGEVQKFIDTHTTVAIERTVLRAYGVEGADPDGVPLVNTCVERFRKGGTLGRGIARFIGRQIVRGAADPQDAAEALAYGDDLDDGSGGPTPEEVARALQ